MEVVELKCKYLVILNVIRMEYKNIKIFIVLFYILSYWLYIFIYIMYRATIRKNKQNKNMSFSLFSLTTMPFSRGNKPQLATRVSNIYCITIII